jgi:hypothetical protein
MDSQAMDSLLVLTSIRTCYCKILMSQQQTSEVCEHRYDVVITITQVITMDAQKFKIEVPVRRF